MGERGREREGVGKRVGPGKEARGKPREKGGREGPRSRGLMESGGQGKEGRKEPVGGLRERRQGGRGGGGGGELSHSSGRRAGLEVKGRGVSEPAGLEGAGSRWKRTDK